MGRDDDVARAVRQRDIGAITRLMFGGNPPEVRPGFKTETELWDFKGDCPPLKGITTHKWSEIAVDVLSFHNNRGGLIVFGIREQDFTFCGTTTRLDSKLINDQLRRYLGDTIWVEFHREFIQGDQRYLGIALVSPRGPRIERFRGDAPYIEGKRRFSEGDSALREGDSSRILSRTEADEFLRKLAVPTVGRTYAIDEPFFRILAPQYERFVMREGPCSILEEALRDPRTAVTALIGIGGAGKTALATWAVLRAYERKDFAFIVSMTAKDRELTTTGIQGLQPGLTSFESLLDGILDALGFPDRKSEGVEEKEKEVRSLLEASNGLIYVDNLETVDDARIIAFLDSLPLGVRAITTSRRTTVRVSVHPVDVGPMTDTEIIEFVKSLERSRGLQYLQALSNAERIRLGRACDGIPLAIRWIAARSRSASDAIAEAEKISAEGRKGDELLEFSFRRVFESLNDAERAVLEVLSLFQRPIPAEAILAASSIPDYRLLDSIEDLIAEVLAQRLFDPDRNDYAYTLLPMTRAFVYAQVIQQPRLESQIRRRLSDWFEAKDVRDAAERRVIREIRQGTSAPESALLDLAVAAQRRRDIYSAEDLYKQALRRNPTSWKAARAYAELLRHDLENHAAALRMYEQAAAHAPRRGAERALIFREWGMLLRDSGDPQATDLAIEKFEAALVEAPNDVLAAHALASMLGRKGSYGRVIELLEPLASHPSRKTREKTLPLLETAYREVGEALKAAQIQEARRRLEAE